jgi:uncharacterized protein (TIGR04255 family)
MLSILPEYDAPPVVEMSLALDFEPLPELRSAHVGMFAASQSAFAWTQLEEDFPRLVAIEQFGDQHVRPPFRLQIAEEVPPPRTVLLNPEAHRSVAVQQDTLEYSWWKDDVEGTYPRHSVVAGEFLPLVEAFRSFIGERNLGQVRVRQVEVTYRNALQRGVDWPEGGTAAQALAFWSALADPALPSVEDAHLGQSHLLRDDDGAAYGRLYVTLDTKVPPPFRRLPETDWASLALTCRVSVRDSGQEELSRHLGRAREAIVRAFTAVTTPEAHTRWRRTR